MTGTPPALDEAPGTTPQMRTRLTQLSKDPRTSPEDRTAIAKALRTGVIPADLLRRISDAEESVEPQTPPEGSESDAETVVESPEGNDPGGDERPSEAVSEPSGDTPSETPAEESARPEPSGPVELVEAVVPDVTGTTDVDKHQTDAPASRRRRIKLISAGWSKNGRYYPDAVLREAARTRVFPAGTPMYIDHPTKTQKEEQPERSIRDLAARLDTDAEYSGGSLYAEATCFGMWHPVLNGPNGLADHIDLSVRCLGEVSQGVVDGREGMVVDKITEGKSVDFVTEGAAGGKILELIESAGETGSGLVDLLESSTSVSIEEGRNIGAWLEARMHTIFTEMADEMYGGGRLSREERIALSSSMGDALSAFVSRVERDQPQLYKRDLYQGPDLSESSTGGEPVEEGIPMTDNGAPAPGTTRALVEKELAEARRERDLAIAQSRARELIPHLIAEAWVAPTTQIRITTDAMGRLPIKDGRLDEVELTKIVANLVEGAERETAETLEAAGIGSPRALGDRMSAGEGFGPNTDELDGRLSEAFSSLGLSEAAVKTAVRGREV